MVRRLAYNSLAWWNYYDRTRRATESGRKCTRWHLKTLADADMDLIDAWALSNRRYTSQRYAIAYAFAGFTQGFDRDLKLQLRAAMRANMAEENGYAVIYELPWFRGTGERGSPFN